jgi:hypothetical protein
MKLLCSGKSTTKMDRRPKMRDRKKAKAKNNTARKVRKNTVKRTSTRTNSSNLNELISLNFMF